MENGVMGEKRRPGMGDTDEIDLGCSGKQKHEEGPMGKLSPNHATCFLVDLGS